MTCDISGHMEVNILQYNPSGHKVQIQKNIRYYVRFTTAYNYLNVLHTIYSS